MVVVVVVVRLRFCVTSCYLRKERIRYRPAPTQNWRNADKVEPDAAKDPML